jgi:hypothetical protein
MLISVAGHGRSWRLSAFDGIARRHARTCSAHPSSSAMMDCRGIGEQSDAVLRTAMPAMTFPSQQEMF